MNGMTQQSPLFQNHIKECLNPQCAFRFPVTEFRHDHLRCPRCGSETRLAVYVPRTESMPIHSELPRSIQLHILLDNIRSTFNVGSIFRSADATGIEQLYLCGITATPDHPKLKKTALGAEQSVAWSYHSNALSAVLTLKQQGFRIWSLEYNHQSTPMDLVTRSELIAAPTILVVGNEVCGVDPEILSVSDAIIHIPMHGIKESFNVAVACSVAIYHFRTLNLP